MRGALGAALLTLYGRSTNRVTACDTSLLVSQADLGYIAAHDYETMERYVGLRSLYIVGGYSWWGWVDIILVEV